MSEVPESLSFYLDNLKTFREVNSFKEAVDLARGAIGGLVSRAFDLPNTGAEKKAIVMKAFADFYDSVIVNVPIPYVPSVLSRKFLGLLKPVAMEIASSVVEDVYKLLAPAK